MSVLFMCHTISKQMNRSPFYIDKDFIGTLSNEQSIQHYEPVQILLDQLKIINMNLNITTHRLIFRSNTNHSLLIKGQDIQDVSITEEGFFSKDYFVKMHTRYGKVKISLKSYNQAKINISSMVAKALWRQPVHQKNETKSMMYGGMFQKIHQERQKIDSHGTQVSQSFASFGSLFGNLRDLKKVMNEMKEKTGQSDGDNPEVNKLLKDMGMISVIDKDEAGKDFHRQLARDLYQVCQTTLFKTFGGMVALLDLYYFYNKKRQLNLLAPEEMLKACEMFQQLGLHAKLVRYPNNIILVQSTSFNPQADFDHNFAKYFSDYQQGYTSDQIARKKGLPVAIVDIKLRQACKTGKLAIDDRIQGIKYYKNLLLSV